MPVKIWFKTRQSFFACQLFGHLGETPDVGKEDEGQLKLSAQVAAAPGGLKDVFGALAFQVAVKGLTVGGEIPDVFLHDNRGRVRHRFHPFFNVERGGVLRETPILRKT